MARTTVDPVDIGKMYDESAPISDTFNEGQIHLAYWYGDGDDTPMVEASKRITRKVADALGLRPGERVLDAGCGLGAPAILIARETGADVTGVTVSAVEAGEAQRKADASGIAERVRFEQADFSALPYGEGHFDAVLAMESLQCAPDLGATLAELFRVLRPGGRITFADYTTEERMGLDEAEAFAAAINLNRLPTLAEWFAALGAAGFAVEEYTQCGPRVFGMGPKFVESAETARGVLAERFGDEMVTGLKDALRDFFAPGPDRIGYVIVSARKPG
ncbi:SAM-dependent methyltransferase [Microbispora sp. ATCC PTA-5024]|uniref:SAM-dependent methyltransferase n=1 Tax=Microbispora sp. ATCC PTA-5024 TaxID=316330 RepID=UPI00040F5DBB|nr:methyltransferase domain-containing protein [Microbispora sp. ATCC PTA-5024]